MGKLKRKDQGYINVVQKSIKTAYELEREKYLDAVAKKTARTVKIAFITITTIIIILSLLA